MPGITDLHSTHKKVTGGTAGEVGNKKMDGYAQGPVPKVAYGTKVGADPSTPYSGPPVAMPPQA